MLKIWLQRNLGKIGIACIVIGVVTLCTAITISYEPLMLTVSETGVYWQRGGGFKWGLVALCIVFFCCGGLAIYQHAKHRRESDRQALDNAFNKIIRKR